ncbi:MAG: hypothetical protein GX481_09130, partial [Atopobium sp.]|nr:hypothetical protein [Atopobium sp.]
MKNKRRLITSAATAAGMLALCTTIAYAQGAFNVTVTNSDQYHYGSSSNVGVNVQNAADGNYTYIVTPVGGNESSAIGSGVIEISNQTTTIPTITFYQGTLNYQLDLTEMGASNSGAALFNISKGTANMKLSAREVNMTVTNADIGKNVTAYVQVHLQDPNHPDDWITDGTYSSTVRKGDQTVIKQTGLTTDESGYVTLTLPGEAGNYTVAISRTGNLYEDTEQMVVIHSYNTDPQ